MPQLSPGQARVVDPILSNHARGYRQRWLIATALFPIAFVMTYGGKTIQFGKESFRVYNSKRAPGSATKRVTFGYEGVPFAIVPSSLEALVPREIMRDASQVPGIDLASRSVNTVLGSLQLEHEVACADIARSTANYDDAHKVTLTDTDRWTGGSASDPLGDIETGKEAIRASVGVYPNVCVLSATTFAALKTNPHIIDRIKHTSREVPTAEILAALFGIETVVIGSAVVASGSADDFGDVWGDDVILAYVNPNTGDAGANREEPSFAYTYAIEGMPLVEQPYWDPNHKSWVYGVSFDNTPVLSGMTAGYLIKDAGAAQVDDL